MPIPIAVEPDWGTPSGGLLTSVRSLPEGWQRGISFTDPSCLSPTVMGECPTGADLKPSSRPDIATFRPVTLIQAVECSTMGGTNVADLAGQALDRTRDHALARELLTGAASARDAAEVANENPSLVGSAIDLGNEFESLTQALACLEANLAEANSGRGGYILVGPALVTHLKDQGLIWRDGSRWRTAAGSLVIVSSGFDGRAPGTASAPDAGAPLYLYAVTVLWGGVGTRDVYGDVNRADNTATARAEDVALAAFSPCAVYASATATTAACLIVPPTPEPEPVPVPVIATVNPTAGPEVGGTTITVSGSGFLEGN